MFLSCLIYSINFLRSHSFYLLPIPFFPSFFLLLLRFKLQLSAWETALIFVLRFYYVPLLDFYLRGADTLYSER